MADNLKTNELGRVTSPMPWVRKIYTNYEVVEVCRYKQKQDINQDIDVLLSPTKPKHSVIEIEMQNIRSCLVI